MVATLTQRIQLIGDNPLDAVVIERHTKAYLVANLAFIEGAKAAAEHYDLELATIYAAMAFYEENREAIESAIETERKRAIENGAINGQDAIAEIKKRMNNR